MRCLKRGGSKSINGLVNLAGLGCSIHCIYESVFTYFLFEYFEAIHTRGELWFYGSVSDEFSIFIYKYFFGWIFMLDNASIETVTKKQYLSHFVTSSL